MHKEGVGRAFYKQLIKGFVDLPQWRCCNCAPKVHTPVPPPPPRSPPSPTRLSQAPNNTANVGAGHVSIDTATSV
ncbi:hypothetical protein LSAT2_013860 [Lamellibrachia satsuma]|nr:hypothetical protein LSAT2_013860 [Lamellibrachia satsuma]